MREIKFRGKSLETGNWIVGFYVENYDSDEFGENRIVRTFIHHLVLGTREVHPESVGSYTGHKDKNDDDIYEGDIVLGLTDGEENIFQIKWLEDKERSGWEIGRYTECEVIGNINDNPELLEEPK